jgi:hypothetical protein
MVLWVRIQAWPTWVLFMVSIGSSQGVDWIALFTGSLVEEYNSMPSVSDYYRVHCLAASYDWGHCFLTGHQSVSLLAPRDNPQIFPCGSQSMAASSRPEGCSLTYHGVISWYTHLSLKHCWSKVHWVQLTNWTPKLPTQYTVECG